MIDDEANFDILDASEEVQAAAKFRPKQRAKPRKTVLSSRSAASNPTVENGNGKLGVSNQDVDATVDLDNHNELINSPIDGTQSMVGEVSVTNSEMDNVSDSYNDKLIDENLSNLSQQTVQKNSNDQEHNEGEPLDPPVEQQPKSGVGEIGSSMKLRSRKKSQKVGTHKDTDDYFDEDFVEPSLAEEDNDSGDDYTAGTTRKVRKKPRDSVEESLQQKVQKDKSQVSSRGRKRTLKDASAEKPEKKLTHRIRQSRAKDNLYFKTVIKNLNIEDVAQQEINNTRKQDGASSERGPGKENVLDDFIHGEEDDSNWLDEEHSVQKPDVQEEEHASGNDDDGDLGDVFDWY
uniref:Uncharacterized protein n=1 Tax=Setaria italica TaxID=4555 RepID=K3YZ34_SETIT